MVSRLREFDAFYAGSWEPVVRSLTLALGDRTLAEDAAQVAFERAFARWARVGNYERPGTWVYVVAIREGGRLRRRQRTEPQADAALASHDDHAAGVESAAWVASVLRELPPRQREAIVLRHVVGLPLRDIASAQRVTIGTVKASLHAAHQRLRVLVDDHEPEEVDDAHR